MRTDDAGGSARRIQTWARRRRRRGRGPRNGADRPRPGARRGPLLRLRLQRRKSFAENIEALAAAGADVIADDVFYFEEPFFQDGPIGVAASEGHRRRRHLPLRGRQRQPVRRQRPRNRLLGSAAVPRLGGLPFSDRSTLGAVRRKIWAGSRPAPDTLPGLQPVRLSGRHDVRHHRRERGKSSASTCSGPNLGSA